MWQRTIDGLGIAVRARTNATGVAELLAAVLRSYADSTGEVQVDYFLDAASVPPALYRDGVRLSEHEQPIDLVPAFEIDMYRRLMSLVSGVPLHAGAVVDAHGNAVIVAGRSGSGKSTLIRRLLLRGDPYLSEECVLLTGSGRCKGLARALNIDDDGGEPPPGYRSDDYPLRHRSERFRMFHPPEHLMWRRDSRAACVIAIEHAAESPNEMVRIRDGEALVSLWPAIFRHTPEILTRMPAAFEGIPKFRLHTSTAENALRHVLALAKERGVKLH
jgi:hypothetical protein